MLARERRRIALHMRDPLYRTAYLLAAGGGVTSLIGFFYWIVAARSYTPRVVGLSSASISAMIFVASVCQLGLPAVLLRDLPTAGRATRKLLTRSYALIFTSALALGLVAALTSGLWSHSLSFLGSSARWVVGFALATAGYAIFQVQDFVLTAFKVPHWVPVENTLFSVGKLVLLAAIVGVSPFAGPFIAWTLPAIVAAVTVTSLIFGRLAGSRGSGAEVGTFDRRRFVSMAAANQLALLLTYVVTLLMPVIVAASRGATATAYFYVPWTIATAITVLPINTTTSLTVEAAGEEEGLARLVRRSLIHTVRLLVPLVALLVALGPYVLRLYGSRYAAHGDTLLRLLALGALPNGVYVVGEALLRIQHRPAMLVLTQGGQCLMFLAISLWLLPGQGIVAVGEAFLASQLAGAAVLLVTALRRVVFTARAAPRASASSAPDAGTH